MTTLTLSNKGQLVIPAAWRKKLEIKPGDQVVARLDEGSNEITIKRADTFDEALELISSWKKPGIEPLTDTRALFNQREPRL
ncbi:MAG: AbrB/MazE/SpoVT family DNA-binding domain-containing protein [Coriobacteriia bacterium]|nr:AbrB/MazE/SpoVT family DNA-binding domain-containing protein [Coriobacteriia bacterium]MCL2537231.1 AbrB/MazE/SpoVT family DNA-binding domain-containing protein [Coriobacteriia bacterium]